MKSLLSAVIVGIVLFAVSGGVSWYLVNQSADAEPEEIASLGDEDAASAFPEPLDEKKKVDAMPVAVRPDVPVTVEAVTKLAQSIMKKEQALFESQNQLRKEEQRINVLFMDLKTERDELSAFGDRIDAKILEAREATELLKQQHQAMSEQSKVLSNLEKNTGTDSAGVVDTKMDERVDIVKKWFKGQKPDQAAKYLTEFANNGDLEFAARLLDTFSERTIPKILEALKDDELATELMDAYSKNNIPEGVDSATRPSSNLQR